LFFLPITKNKFIFCSNISSTPFALFHSTKKTKKTSLSEGSGEEKREAFSFFFLGRAAKGKGKNKQKQLKSCYLTTSAEFDLQATWEGDLPP
jgi:hypothetical protein